VLAVGGGWELGCEKRPSCSSHSRPREQKEGVREEGGYCGTGRLEMSVTQGAMSTLSDSTLIIHLCVWKGHSNAFTYS